MKKLFLIAAVFRLQRIVGQNGIVHRLLNRIQFVLGQHRPMGKIEPKPVRRDQRPRPKI